MFKFRRRNALVRKLQKEAALAPADGQRLAGLLAGLAVHQLEMLQRAVAARGDAATAAGCVLVENLGDDDEPHLLCCRAWRRRGGADDEDDGADGDGGWRAGGVRRLPVCGSAADKVYVCVNPYHLSKLCVPEYVPPPYSRLDHINPEDRAQIDSRLVFRDSSTESLTTNGENSSSRNHWCQLAYWERRQRVGRLFPVELPYVNIFWDVPYGDGMSIKELSRDNTNTDMVKARKKIGLGITVSRESNQVWVYNRSSVPIFVSSVTLRDERASASPVRVPDQQCLCVFDEERAPPATRPTGGDVVDGPVDCSSITISFGKGWGSNYSRMEISACPCWLEVLLAPCR